MHRKTHPVDCRVVRLWLLREICHFLSGRISSGKFDDDFSGGTKFKLIANDPTCYDVAYVFWSFYDDFKDQQWSELFDADKEENRETVRIIGDILILLTSEFEFAGKKKDGCLKTLLGAVFRLLFFWRYFSWKWSAPRPPYPFLSESDRDAAREQFLLHRAEYVPKFIPQSVYDIYIAAFFSDLDGGAGK
ncbi:MAG: hypothetical protein IKQ16_04950 [Lentisphaeria bacterium]|nr:hypothetical protein [Lentisphaeria bacterium]